MEWSRVPGNQKKREKKEEEESTSPAFSRSLRFILENSPPLFKKKKKSPEPYAYAKYASRQRIGGTYSAMRRNWRENEFFTFGQTLLFFSSHDVRIPFWRGV